MKELPTLLVRIDANAHILGLYAAISQKRKDAIVVCNSDRFLEVENQEVLPPAGISHICGSNAAVGGVDACFRGIGPDTRYSRKEIAVVVRVDFQLACRTVLEVSKHVLC